MSTCNHTLRFVPELALSFSCVVNTGGYSVNKNIMATVELIDICTAHFVGPMSVLNWFED